MMDQTTRPQAGASARATHRRRSKFAAAACRVLALAVPVLLIVSWALGDSRAAILARFGLPADHQIGALQTGLAFGVSLVPVLALAAALLAAARCFDGFAQGDWFGERQPKDLGLTGAWLVVSGLTGLVAPTLLGLILSANAGPGARVLAVEISGGSLTSCLIGALLWTLGHVWARAREIAAENEGFV
jgi:hypothetical protein